MCHREPKKGGGCSTHAKVQASASHAEAGERNPSVRPRGRQPPAHAAERECTQSCSVSSSLLRAPDTTLYTLDTYMHTHTERSTQIDRPGGMLAASKAAPQLEGFHTRTPFNRSSTVSVLRFGEQRCKHPPLRLLLLLARQSGRNRLSIYTGAAREITPGPGCRTSSSAPKSSASSPWRERRRGQGVRQGER